MEEEIFLIIGAMVIAGMVGVILLIRRSQIPDIERTKAFTNMMNVCCEACGAENPEDVDDCLICSKPLMIPARILRPDAPPEALGNLTLIGRSPDCNIILKGDIYVSRYHARIERQNDHFVITNLSQRNFTKLNGHYLRQPTVLSNEDQIQVGKTVLTAELNYQPPVARPVFEGLLVGESGKSFTLGNSTWIGRAPECDMAIDEEYVSRHHAWIERQRNQFILIDNNSDNGTFVNREPVMAPRTLQNGDQLTFGMSTLTFELIRQTLPDSEAIPSSAKNLSTGDVKRYGRVEYASPMDLNRSYPLRVGLLVDRMPDQYEPNARVRWTTIPLMPVKQDPKIVIRASSSYCHIEPAFKEIIVRPFDNIYTDFLITPVKKPETPGGQTEIFVDFEYQGDVVKRINVNTAIQDQFGIGPLQVPHDYWKYFAVIAAGIGLIDAAASLLRETTAERGTTFFLMVAGFILATSLLAICPIMYRRAARKLERAV